MLALGVSGSRLTRGSMPPNALRPDLMTPAERLAEIAEILGAAILRLRRRQSASKSSQLEKFPLDFSPDRSVHATGKRRRVAQ